MVRIWIIIPLAGMLAWNLSSTQVAFAESGAEPKNGPVVKQDQGAERKDIVTRHLDGLTRRLGLTTEQREAIRSVLADEQAQLNELRADESLSQEERKIRREALRDATDARIRPLLTPDQQIRRDAILREKSERRKLKEESHSTAIPAN